MANNPKAKLKTLYLMRILQDETDAEHGLSLRQIIERLADYGIQAERKSLYRDIEVLREFGFDIQTFQRNPVQYAIVKRDFTLSELMLLVNAVESCKFLTARQSRTLTTNLKLLASDHERVLLDRRIHVPGRITSKVESVFGSIDMLHEAMRCKRKVKFMYYKYGLDGKRHATHGGKPHLVTPVGITFSDGYYYLTAWNDDHECMTEYRIDRMERLDVSSIRATRNEQITHHEFEGEDHEVFGRFGGEPVTATLLVDSDKAEIIMDRFGDAAEWFRHDDETAQVVVKIRKSEPFFGWVSGLGGTVRIHAPKSLKEEYREYLKRLLED
ncbi:helix-turn-helix transcriptional regulator [Adlercreutzia murintestinalis]|uniref:helix-turn-helix transcriptional regulator n=1 Tax=Adlercreutzia murintestinalis TaxID=2941325 RepID=UPI00203F4E7A|nr:WYL domain-containing protein [Adlercreutzia murintestinalis]